MDLLVEYIKSILVERALPELEENMSVKIEQIESNEVLFRLLAKKDEKLQHIAGVTIVKIPENGACLDAWMISYSESRVRGGGWGSLLYELAIEWASMQGGGLMADRLSVSGDALKVWQRLDQRADVKKMQLDDLLNTLTPEKRDNCKQVSSGYDVDVRQGAEQSDKEAFAKSVLSRVYRKGPDLAAKLNRAGKLVDETGVLS